MYIQEWSLTLHSHLLVDFHWIKNNPKLLPLTLDCVGTAAVGCSERCLPFKMGQ